MGQKPRKDGTTITPLMVSAGVSALRDADDELLGCSSAQTLEGIAVAAYVAMERARWNEDNAGH